MKLNKLIKSKSLYRSTFLIVCFSLLFGSCAKYDLLNLDNPGAVDENKAWTTDYITRLGMNGIYATLRYGIDSWGASGREVYQFDRFVTSQVRDADPMTSGSATSSYNKGLYIWKDMYEGIDRANDAILNIPTKSQSSEVDKSIFVAEAKFLRAYFYTRLNQVFRGVPLYTEPIKLGNLEKARESEARIWEFVIQDLTDCINEPNFPMKIKAKSGDYGKATKGAAYALRGKAYMYLYRYEDAISDFNKVKEAGYDLYQGDYKSLFKEVNEQCDEMIFSLQHIGVPNLGSIMHFYLGPRTTINGGGWGTYQVTPYIVDLYDNKDGSRFNWDDVIPEYNAMNESDREVYFIRDTVGLVEKFMEAGLAVGDAQSEAAAVRTSVQNRLNSFSADVKAKYLPNGNESRIKKAYENRDPRLAASVITPYSTFLGSISNVDVLVTSRWPYRNDGAGVRDLRTDMVNYFYYMHRKFVYEGTSEAPNREYGPIDFPLIRYADVLLMKAEALNELGRMNDAIEAVNAIRGRAGVALLNSSPINTVANVDQLRDRIRDERRIEMVIEGISYFDELRWGTLKETTFGKVGGSRQIWGGLVNKYQWTGDKKLYSWPIPLSEIQMNMNLTQNPEWGN